MTDAPQLSFNQGMINPGEASEELQRRTLVQLIKEERVEEARQFLARSADPRALVQAKSPETMQTPLFQAVQIKNKERAFELSRALLDLGAPASSVDTYGQTPLFHICREGNVPLLELFLDRGAKINEEDFIKQTPLFYAAREGHIELVKTMLARGAEADHLDKLRETALFYAARDGRVEVCQALIDSGANVNTVDEKKQTALYFALKNNNTAVVDLLVARGAVRTKDGRISKNDQLRLQRRDGGEEKETPQKLATHHKKKKPATVEEQRLAYRLVYTDQNLRSRELTESEFLKLKEVCPQLCRVLQNPELLTTDTAVQEIVHQPKWQHQATSMVENLRKSKIARIFNEPVDWVKLKIPDYPRIVQQPMDLGTVKKKLGLNVYQSAHQFVEDVNLVFTNCRLYNGTESVVGKMGVELNSEWETLLRNSGLLERLGGESHASGLLDLGAPIEGFFARLQADDPVKNGNSPVKNESLQSFS